MNYKDLYHEIKNDDYEEDSNGKTVERLVIQKLADKNENIVYSFDVIVYPDKHQRALTLFYIDSTGLFEINNIRSFTKENQTKIVKFLAAGTKEWFKGLPTDVIYTIPIGAETYGSEGKRKMLYTKNADSLTSGEYGISSEHMVEPANIFFEEKDIDNLKHYLNDDFKKVIDLCKTKVGERL